VGTPGEVFSELRIGDQELFQRGQGVTPHGMPIKTGARLVERPVLLGHSRSRSQRSTIRPGWNPHGIAALSAVVGMFTKQATNKLDAVLHDVPIYMAFRGGLLASASSADVQQPK